MIPAGSYQARVAQRGWDKTKAGAAQYAVEFEVTHGREMYTRVLLRVTFSENAAKIAVEQLRRLGWRGVDLSTLDAAALPERHTIEVTHRVVDGKTYADVNVVAWVPKPGLFSPAQLVTLSQRCRGAFAETDRRLGLPEQEPPADRAEGPPADTREPGSDDDSTFD